MFELQELRIFSAIVETGGFQKAAQAIRISQPAVSQSIANLERKLGEKILDRKSPMTLTPIGKELLRTAQIILEKEKEFSRDLKRLKDGYLQKLCLAVDYLINEYSCHKYVQQTLTKIPEINLKIHRMPAREMISAVSEGVYELGLGAFQKDMPQLKKHEIFREKTILVTGKKHPLVKLCKSDPFHFLSQTVLLSSYLDEPGQRPSKKKIRDYFKDTWEINNISLQINLLNQGIGATFIPQTILETHPIARKFIPVENLPFSQIHKPYGIYYKKDAKLSYAAETFLHLVLEREPC